MMMAERRSNPTGRAKAFLFLLFALLCLSGVAQRKQKLKTAANIQLNDSLVQFSQSDIFRFPNVNRVAYFRDDARIGKLKALDNSGQEELLYRELKSYVANFGIDNFSKQTPMIWRLAKLSEKFGPKGEAVLLYKLVLKHHQQGIDLKEVYARHDSIETNRKDLFVPLDEYYKLVAYRKEIDTLRPPHAVLTDMGYHINSDKEDYGPTIGNVDYLLLFTSKRNRHTEKNTYDEDIFYSAKLDGTWQDAFPFKSINTSYNEGSACLSLDGKFLYFSRCNSPDGRGSCDLFEATLKRDSTWGNVRNMGPAINSSGWDSHPSLSHSGDTLFFASNRIGGFGLSDIYFSARDKSGAWSQARNLGPIINTNKSEVSPFFHHRHNVLYFSSDGQPLCFGDFDIYKSNYQNGTWQEPKNIGPLVNGAGSEYYFTIDSESHDLYYARSAQETKDNLDLFSFPVPMEAQPTAVVALRGSLKTPEGKPLKGIVSIIDLDQGVEVAPKYLREDGTFDFELINKRNYLLIIQGDDFFRIEELFFLDGDKQMDRVAEPIEARIAFKSLEFENGKSEILPAMHGDLNKLGNFLVDHPDLVLEISGHTDSAGKEEANRKLSQDRADAIRLYLIESFKVELDRIQAKGFGSSKPIVKEVREEDKQLNRRVEFQISRAQAEKD
jgi:outer membrane protein OmpA-like peptidoglycan-associated protein